jgi:hypothetical protein
MNALSTFFDRVFFAVLCVVAWVIYPVFIVGGAVALLIYALIAELSSPMAAAPPPLDGHHLPARRPASGLCESPQP